MHRTKKRKRHHRKRDTGLGRLWLRSLVWGARDRRHFRAIETYCMFIGYPRSGHTLVAALLDAHPEIILATGGRAARLIRRGFAPLQTYAVLLERSRFLAATGRKRGGYRYNVPNQWPGRFRNLKVIGDKWGADGLLLGLEPTLVPRLRRLAGGNVRFLHVVRNPFDTITSMKKRKNKPLDEKADIFFRKAEEAARSIELVGSDTVLEIHHEDFVVQPRQQLNRVCEFLGVETTADYLEDCASVVNPIPNRSREKKDWSPELVASVEERMKHFDFLDRYSFQD